MKRLHLRYGVTLGLLLAAVGIAGASGTQVLAAAAQQTTAPCPEPGAIVGVSSILSSTGDPGGTVTQTCGLPDRSTSAQRPYLSTGSTNTDSAHATTYSVNRSGVGVNPAIVGSGLCPGLQEWAIISGNDEFLCVSNTTDTWSVPWYGSLELINNTYVDVFLEGSGWSDCFTYGDMYILGGRDIDATGLRVSSDTESCAALGYGNQSTAICSHTMSFFSGLLNANHVSNDECFTEFPYSYSPVKTPVLAILNASGGYRVWLNGPASNPWSACFNYGDARDLAGTSYTDPAKLVNTTNTNGC